MLIPFEKIGKWLSLPAAAVDPDPSEQIILIRDDLASVKRYFPFVSNCFSLGATGMTICRWQKISSQMYFGVAKNEHGKLIAHAWLKHDGVFISGQEGYERFSPVKVFTSTSTRDENQAPTEDNSNL